VKDCYAALGSIHATWKPVQGRFKDYVAMPKFNLYQSLHTTVIGPGGKPLEVQIRTWEMHQRAEFGVAAHYSYKEGAPAGDIAWLNRIVDWQKEVSDPATFMETLKTDLEQDEVFVFTPKGKVITLPVGSTPVDFAYAVHTQIGHACIGARVNGRLVPLDSKLSSGDTCEIFTSKVEGAGPSRDWLQFVRSPRARSKIRQWFSRERREDAMDAGRDELLKALRREGLPAAQLVGSDQVAKQAAALGYENVEALYVAIGEHHVAASSIARKVALSLRDVEQSDEFVPATARAPRRTRRRQQFAGVHVEGLDDVMVRLSKCCTPVPGDEIIGFVTRGRGVSVHRADCANAVSLAGAQAARLIDVEWDSDTAGQVFVAAIEVKALDRSRLLRDVSNVLADQHVNITACSTHTGSDRISRMRFEFELADPGHLDSVIRTIKTIDSVYDAYRVVPGGG
jgi:GTP pyrophosphokinase